MLSPNRSSASLPVTINDGALTRPRVSCATIVHVDGATLRRGSSRKKLAILSRRENGSTDVAFSALGRDMDDSATIFPRKGRGIDALEEQVSREAPDEQTPAGD